MLQKAENARPPLGFGMILLWIVNWEWFVGVWTWKWDGRSKETRVRAGLPLAEAVVVVLTSDRAP